ncbi:MULTISPECIES: hypothetical protein [Anaeromyxobacter]|uniref:hypothetical protein n=1 Tax=Anaeromyxobacter TaxID=161492 RepID=UPI001F595E73|nr:MULTISPECIES: hypothetical protein [unclassified Anaeromyxobacter]
MTLTPYQGGRRLMAPALVAAVAGLALTAVGGLVDPRRALFAYLVAFVYWLGIALGALILLGAFHASNARWPVVLRRFVETVPAALPLFAVLFVPIALGMKHLFVWMAPPETLAPEMAHAVHHKLPYLNAGFFLGRAAVYFVFWIVVAHLLRSWSIRQDSAGGATLTRWQRRLGAGSLPFLALTLTFASFDWMMSLDPRFFSTIFGVYWFAGSFMAAFAVTIIAATLSRPDPTAFGHHMSLEHFHSLGKFLLAFTAFWAYVAFSQFMLIWIANVPEEVPWYILRIDGGWKWVGIFLALFHFVVPFFLLLSRDLKRTPRALSLVAGWLLLVHWVDLYWLVMPHLDPAGPRPSLWDLAAFVGVGGAAVAFTLFRLRGASPVPVRDPYLEDSLRYLPQ